MRAWWRVVRVFPLSFGAGLVALVGFGLLAFAGGMQCGLEVLAPHLPRAV